MWAAATLRRSGTPGPTPSPSVTRSSSRSNRASTGAGAMSTKPSSEETPDLQGAYPRLSEAQIAALAAQGRRRTTQPEEILFREGDRDCDFFVVLNGRVAAVEGYGTPEQRVIAVHG